MPQEDKVKAIQNAPSPTNVSELKAFLGLVTFYNRFLHNLANILQPLYNLLRHGVVWKWDFNEQAAFNTVKNMIINSPILTKFDKNKEIYLECDASPCGVGAVISHKINGFLHPIAFASRTLSAAQRNYSQIDKEMLAITFGLNKFYYYLAGRHIHIVSENKPLCQ